MTAAPPEPTLEDIAAARAAVDGKPPTAVLEAFLPTPAAHHGVRLIPLTAGHELLLAQLSHPLSTGAKWDATDVLVAFFVFSRPSDLLFESIAADTFQPEFLAFITGLPAAATEGLGDKLIKHWLGSRKTAVAMESEHGQGKKKAADSAGFSPPSPPPAGFMAGVLTRFCTAFRWCKFWH